MATVRATGIGVQLSFGPGERLTGRVATGAAQAPVDFVGWSGLLEVLEALRRAQAPDHHYRSPDGGTKEGPSRPPGRAGGESGRRKTT